MPLKLMYITNSTEVALIAESCGVERIFVDMEYIGKSERQGGMDTVQSHHTIDDIKRLRNVLSKSHLLVRINPIHSESAEYCSSADEINDVIAAGADIIMLPYFKTADEVRKFISLVDGRARTMLLIETTEAVECIDEILSVSGIDEVFVGLNDLSLGYGKKFMFELLADGTVEELCLKFRKKGLPYGFGGIAAIGKGMLPAERIIAEHYRLGSTCVILSRSFCNTTNAKNTNGVSEIFANGISDIRNFENQCDIHMSWFWDNQKMLCNNVFELASTK